MLRDLSLIVSPVLVLLLMVLTPVGTGQGTHRDQLLDPLFPHVHFADGSTMLLRNPQRVVEQRGEGPALGAGAGAASAALGLGLTPPTPGWPTLLVVGDSVRPIVGVTTRPAGALADPPPDPPPTTG
jgi:hypothetical protein